MHNMTVVCKLMPSLSINDYYQTLVFHQSIIVPRTVIGVVIVVRYFSARTAIHIVTRSLSIIIQSYIIKATNKA